MSVAPGVEVLPVGNAAQVDVPPITAQPDIAINETGRQRAEGRRALKAAIAMAGSSVTATVIGLGSTKAVALIYGPSGTAKIGLLAATYSTIALVFGLGVDQAATKRIAETRLSDPARHATIVRTALVLTVLLGAIAAVFTLAGAPILAKLLTGKPGLAGDVRLISIVVALTIVAGGPGAYLHGTRQISRLAAANPLAATVGTVVSVTALVVGVNLIASTLVIGQVFDLAVLLIIGRRAFAVARSRGAHVSPREAAGVITLGGVFAAGSVATLLSGLALRVIVAHRLGLAETGQFQAAYGAMATGFQFILLALTVDYYPRLTQTGSADVETNRVANHQIEFSLSLVAPVALAGIIVAPLGIRLLYSGAYAPAGQLTQIFALSMFLQALAWNLGFIMPAREAKTAFLGSQIVVAVSPVVCCLVLLPRFGVTATAISEVVTQAVMFCYVTAAARRYSGFRFSSKAKLRIVMTLPACLIAVLVGRHELGIVVQLILFCIVATFSARALSQELGVPFREIPRRLWARMRGARSQPSDSSFGPIWTPSRKIVKDVHEGE